MLLRFLYDVEGGLRAAKPHVRVSVPGFGLESVILEGRQGMSANEVLIPKINNFFPVFGETFGILGRVSVPKFAAFQRRLESLLSRFLQAPEVVETRLGIISTVGDV